MKRLLFAALAVLLAALMTVPGAAASRGRAYIEHNGYYDEEITNAAPGDTVYIALMEKSSEDDDYEIDRDDQPKEAEIRSVDVIGFIDDDEYDLIETGELEIVTEEIEDGVVWYFAELPIEDIDLEDYPEDGFYVEGTLRVTRRSGKSFTINLEDVLKSISFSDTSDTDELKKTEQLYRFKSGKEIKLKFPNGKGWYEGRTREAISVYAAMKHTKNFDIVDANDEDARLTFYIGNGAEFEGIRNGKIVIEADDDDYLYEIDAGKLRDRSDYYDDDEEAFVIETDTLGSYVVSDMKLSSRYDYDESEDDDKAKDSDDKDDDDEYVYYVDDDDDDDDVYVSDWNDYGYVIVNPNTGAEN